MITVDVKFKVLAKPVLTQPPELSKLFAQKNFCHKTIEV